MTTWPAIKTARELVADGVVLCLTEPQRQMLLASGPDDITGLEGVGVELRTGGHYASAKSLERYGYGHRVGPGGETPGMFWANAEGLAIRAAICRSIERG